MEGQGQAAQPPPPPHLALPIDAPRAEDVATQIELNSRASSIDLGHDKSFPGDKNFKLELVNAKDKVHPSNTVVKDSKTGKHYKKVPKWSLAHTLGGEGQKRGNAGLSTGNSSHPPKFSLAHSFAQGNDASGSGTGGGGGSRHNSRPNTPTTSSRPGTSGGTMAPAAVGLTAADVGMLMEGMRKMVREEMNSAQQGHREHLEKVITDNFPESDRDAIEATRLKGDSVSSGSQTTEGSKSGNIGTTTAVLDPVQADRGVKTNNDEAGVVDDDDEGEEEEIEFPNPWARIRYNCREFFSEFLGCLILMTFGDGINVQALFSQTYDPTMPKGQYLSVSFGWGVAVLLAVYVSGGVSGHINPAVTLSLALFRKFPWKKVPLYMLAQISGATLGALMIYGLYVNPIRAVDPGQTETTAQFFTTYPASFLEDPSTRITTFYNEVYATAMLLIVILAVNDSGNSPPPDGLAPLILLWLVWGLGACLGWQSAYAVNPARDLGPRIALSIVGYRGLWTFNAWYWLWTPTLGPLVGGPLGCFVYDAMIYTGSDSPLNRPWKWSDVRWPSTSKKQIPAGVGRAEIEEKKVKKSERKRIAREEEMEEEKKRQQQGVQGV